MSGNGYGSLPKGGVTIPGRLMPTGRISGNITEGLITKMSNTETGTATGTDPGSPSPMQIRILVGRLNPVTRSHVDILKEMALLPGIPVVILVTAHRDARNPLDLVTRRQILREALGPHSPVRILSCRNPFVLVRKLLRRPNLTLLAHHCGPDRTRDYETWYPQDECEVIEHRYANGTRGSQARDAARRLDTRGFRLCCPPAAWPYMNEIATACHGQLAAADSPPDPDPDPQPVPHSNHTGIEALFGRRRRFR